MPHAPYQRAHVALARSMGGSGHPSRVKIDIVDYNDTHTHREVLSAWDRAFKKSRDRSQSSLAPPTCSALASV